MGRLVIRTTQPGLRMRNYRKVQVKKTSELREVYYYYYYYYYHFLFNCSYLQVVIVDLSYVVTTVLINYSAFLK